MAFLVEFFGSLRSCGGFVSGCNLELAGPVRYHFHHGLVELLVAYHIVLIAIYLAHDLIPDGLISILKGGLAHAAVEDGPDLLLADVAIAVFVEDVERDS